MEVIVNNNKLNQDSIENFLMGKIKNIVINNNPTIIDLGNQLNKLSKESNIVVKKNGKKRKLNTFIKEHYGGLENYIEKSNILKIVNNKIEINEEEDFILL